MAAIELLCRQHSERNPGGSGVTFVDGLWAYCLADAPDGHDWVRIPPTERKQIDLAKSLEEFRKGEQG